MIWLARWLEQWAAPKGARARERYYRLWAFVIGPALILFFLWRHFVIGSG